MKSMAVIAVVAAALAVPGWAQHGGGGHGGGAGGHSGGFSGHAGGFGGHSGFGGHAAGVGGASGFTGFGGVGAPLTPMGHGGLGGVWNPGGPRNVLGPEHSGRGWDRGRREGGRGWYGGGLGYGYIGVPYAPSLWYNPDFWGMDEDDSNANAAPDANSYEQAPPADQGYPYPSGPAPYGYGMPPAQSGGAGSYGYAPAPATNNGSEESAYSNPPEQGYAARPPYTGSAGIAPPSKPQQPTTVVFKDGHREQIHNYLITASALTVLDPQYQQIPLDAIDLPATEQVNRAVGIDFHVPRG